MIYGLYKEKTSDLKHSFDNFISLWNKCKENNEVPTQIVIGSKVFNSLLKDKRWKSIFYSIQPTSFQPLGLVGRIEDVDILTDFYIEDESQLKWSIEEEDIVFNIGNKLVGKL